MTLLVELDPIGPDGRPSSTTVWCPCCEEIYRVPFEKRNSWLCTCRLNQSFDLSVALLPPSEVPDPCTCEWVRVNGATGKRITTAELEAAKREATAERQAAFYRRLLEHGPGGDSGR